MKFDAIRSIRNVSDAFLVASVLAVAGPIGIEIKPQHVQTRRRVVSGVLAVDAGGRARNGDPSSDTA